MANLADLSLEFKVIGALWLLVPIMCVVKRYSLPSIVKIMILATLMAVGTFFLTHDAYKVVSDWLYPGVRIFRNSPEAAHVSRVPTRGFLISEAITFGLAWIWLRKLPPNKTPSYER